MKKVFLLILSLNLLFSCNNKKDKPNVSSIAVNIQWQRFDQDFFSIDSNNVLSGLQKLHEKYPMLTSIFLNNVLGLDSASTLAGVKRFLHQSQSLDDSVNAVFKDTRDLANDFKKAFQFVKYYFPDYRVPTIISVVGPIDGLAQKASGSTPDFLGANFCGISLQFYLGKDFSVYQDPFFIDNVAPSYRSRRFSKEYIIPDAMQLIVDDLFPDNSSGRPLIEQMIERGKQWWLLDKFLPTTADSVKTGYTQAQLDWCNDNEGLIWSYIIKNEDIYSINPATIQTYIGEGPFTQGFSQDLSPGNIGQWIGWRIVKKFAAANSGISPEEIMKTPAKKIVDEAKYKPK